MPFAPLIELSVARAWSVNKRSAGSVRSVMARCCSTSSGIAGGKNVGKTETGDAGECNERGSRMGCLVDLLSSITDCWRAVGDQKRHRYRYREPGS